MEEQDEVQIAIAALNSLKGSGSSSSTAGSVNGHEEASPRWSPSPSPTNGNGNGISLPSISHMLREGGNADDGVGTSRAAGRGMGGLQYSYVTANGGGRGSSSKGGQRGTTTATVRSGSSGSSRRTARPPNLDDVAGPGAFDGSFASSSVGQQYSLQASTTSSLMTATTSSPGTPPFERHDRSKGPAGVDGQAGHVDALQQHHLQLQHALALQQGDEGFIGRVSQFPLVSGTLKLYERGRNSSRVVKYGTDLVESSVKTIGQPVINRVVGPSLVGQLDDFACRQLDRFGNRAGTSPLVDTPSTLQAPDDTPSGSIGSLHRHQNGDYFPSPEAYHRRPHGKGRAQPGNEEADYPDDDASSVSAMSEAPTMTSERSLSTTSSYSYAMMGPPQTQIVRSSSLNQNQQPNNAVATRSRWQNLVIEAGVTAGGIGAAVSEESMKSLKYCLHWLHYATAHLDHQVGILRDFILSFSSVHRHDSLIRSTEDSRAAEILNGIKRDVVETIRKVVDVVSTYAGSALPEQAKRYVRSSILGLPERWTRAMQELPPAEGSEQGAAATAQQSSNGRSQPQPQPMGPTQAAAERTLTFAVESLDMLRGVLGIFTDSVERADAWVERLRVVGLQRQQALSQHARQGRNGIATSARRGSAPYPVIASSSLGSSGTSSSHSQSTSSSQSSSGTLTPTTNGGGVKRRGGEEEGDKLQTLEAGGLHQRKGRKNSRTSGARGSASSVDDGASTNGMDVDEE